MSNLLKESLLSAPIIYQGEYPYIIHPLCDGFPAISPDLISEVVHELTQIIKPYMPFDKLVTVEAMGIPITTLLSQELSIPFTIIRKRWYNLDREICIKKQTGYAQSDLFLNGITKHESIVFIDDIISTGGTIDAIFRVLHDLQVNIKAGVVVIDKGNQRNTLSVKTGTPLHSLINISIQQNRIAIL